MNWDFFYYIGFLFTRKMDNKIFTAYLVLLIALSPINGLGQDLKDIELLKKRPFGKYFISDMYSPNTTSSMGMGLLRSEYNISQSRNSTYSLFIESVIGTELPVLNWEINGVNPSRLAISIPVSASLLLDISEPVTHPLINTDYRIGSLEINYLYEIGIGFFKNAGIKLIPYYHESSHLGDELTIYRETAGFPITRVNATSNTAEFAITINDENGESTFNHSFRVGSSMLWNKANGFYRMRPVEGDTSKISPSQNRFVWYGQYQWHGPSGITSNQNFTSVLSLEIRNRVLYDYPYYIYNITSSQPPIEVYPNRKFVPSLNGYAGMRYRIGEERVSHLGIYFRFYLGVNPHGQFRNIPTHRFYSLSLVYEN